MTDFQAAVATCVRSWCRGRVVLPPHRSRANWGGFGASSRAAGGRRGRGIGAMIMMQEKGLMPPRAAQARKHRRAKPVGDLKSD